MHASVGLLLHLFVSVDMQSSSSSAKLGFTTSDAQARRTRIRAYMQACMQAETRMHAGIHRRDACVAKKPQLPTPLSPLLKGKFKNAEDACMRRTHACEV